MRVSGIPRHGRRRARGHPRARCGKEGDDASAAVIPDRQMHQARAARQLPSETQTGHVTTSGRDGHRRTGSSKKGMFQMNFKDKRTRRIAVASASAALVTAGGVTALNAIAAGETLTFGPTATSATILGLDPTPATADGTIAANVSYGLKVTGTSGTDPLKLGVVTGPAGGSVLMQRKAANATPTNGAANWTAVTLGGADTAV